VTARMMRSSRKSKVVLCHGGIHGGDGPRRAYRRREADGQIVRDQAAVGEAKYKKVERGTDGGSGRGQKEPPPVAMLCKRVHRLRLGPATLQSVCVVALDGTIDTRPGLQSAECRVQSAEGSEHRPASYQEAGRRASGGSGTIGSKCWRWSDDGESRDRSLGPVFLPRLIRKLSTMLSPPVAKSACFAAWRMGAATLYIERLERRGSSRPGLGTAALSWEPMYLGRGGM
jgi:hypothetical protein